MKGRTAVKPTSFNSEGQEVEFFKSSLLLDVVEQLHHHRFRQVGHSGKQVGIYSRFSIHDVKKD